MEKHGQLHCGACMENFENVDDLNKHIAKCPAAITMLPIIFKVWSGKDNIGHPLSHFLRNLHENAHIIKQYAYAIADEMDSLSRSKIHCDLCKKLGINYNEFKPFESSKIKKMPTRTEAEWILWEALSQIAKKEEKNEN